MHKITDEELTGLLSEFHGCVAKVARVLRVPRQTLSDRIHANLALKRVLFDVEEGKVDTVESALYLAAIKGNVRAIELFLTRHPLARARGWAPESSNGGGQSVQFHAHTHTYMAGGGAGPQPVADVQRAIAGSSLEQLKYVQEEISKFYEQDSESQKPIVLEVKPSAPSKAK